MVNTQKHADLSNGRLFWKSLVPLFRRTTLSCGFKKKPLRQSVFLCQDNIQLKFYRKSHWTEQPFIFCLFHQGFMNNFVQTCALFNMVLGQLPPRKIAPNPKTNSSPQNRTLTWGQFSSGAIVRIPFNIWDNLMYRTWLCKSIKKGRSRKVSISATSVMNWEKHNFSLWVSLS